MWRKKKFEMKIFLSGLRLLLNGRAMSAVRMVRQVLLLASFLERIRIPKIMQLIDFWNHLAIGRRCDKISQLLVKMVIISLFYPQAQSTRLEFVQQCIRVVLKLLKYKLMVKRQLNLPGWPTKLMRATFEPRL